MQVNQTQTMLSAYSINIQGEFTFNSSDKNKSPSSLLSDILKQTSDNSSKNSLLQDIKNTNSNSDSKDGSSSFVVKFNIHIQSISYASSSTSINLSGDQSKNMDKIKAMLDKMDVSKTGYSGKAIQDMSPDEAKSLVSENGFFGVDQTSKRLSSFVLKGGGDSVSMLRLGRDGIMQGMKEAEKLWGGKLPDIAYQTIQKTTDLINKKIVDLGGNMLDSKA